VPASGSLSISHRSSTVSSPTRFPLPVPDLLSSFAFANMSVRSLIAKFEALAASTAARATSSCRSSSDVDVRAHIQHYESLHRSAPTPTELRQHEHRVPAPTQPATQAQATAALATHPRAATASSSSLLAVEKVQTPLAELHVVIANASLDPSGEADAHTYKPTSAPARASTTTPAVKKSRCQVDHRSSHDSQHGCPAAPAAAPAPVATLPRLTAIQLLPTQAAVTSAPARFGMRRRCLKAAKSRLFAFREDPKFLQQCAESRQRRTESAATKWPTWRR